MSRTRFVSTRNHRFLCQSACKGWDGGGGSQPTLELEYLYDTRAANPAKLQGSISPASVLAYRGPKGPGAAPQDVEDVLVLRQPPALSAADSAFRWSLSSEFDTPQQRVLMRTLCESPPAPFAVDD